MHRIVLAAAVLIGAAVWVNSTRADDPARLTYNDGGAEGKKSMAGAGPMISFTLPDEGAKVAAVRIHGPRYGTPQPSQESFMIYFLNEDASETVATRMAPIRDSNAAPRAGWKLSFPSLSKCPRTSGSRSTFARAAPKGSM